MRTGEIRSQKLDESPSSPRRPRRRVAHGFTLLESLLVISLAMILLALGIPNLMSTIHSYRLNAAMDAAAGVVQGTRYQAVMHGYPYEVTLDSTTNSYQLLSDPNSTGTFANVGSEVPLTAYPVVLSGTTTFLFKPNGSVSAVAGGMTFTITYQNRTATITVSNYGSITHTIQ